MARLSERLRVVADSLIPTRDVWDFCCDHGYLGGSAYKSEKFKNIYFVDPIESIISNLKQRFYKHVFNEKNTSQAHFLTVKGQNVNQSVTGTACIIGVGGLLIYDILKQLTQNQHLKAQRLILGPHRDNEKLLQLIDQNSFLKNYKLSTVKVISENTRSRRFYIFDLNN